MGTEEADKQVIDIGQFRGFLEQHSQASVPNSLRKMIGIEALPRRQQVTVLGAVQARHTDAIGQDLP